MNIDELALAQNCRNIWAMQCLILYFVDDGPIQASLADLPSLLDQASPRATHLCIELYPSNAKDK